LRRAATKVAPAERNCLKDGFMGIDLVAGKMMNQARLQFAKGNAVVTFNIAPQTDLGGRYAFDVRQIRASKTRLP
jgi:hypothetical protein